MGMCSFHAAAFVAMGCRTRTIKTERVTCAVVRLGKRQNPLTGRPKVRHGFTRGHPSPRYYQGVTAGRDRQPTKGDGNVFYINAYGYLHKSNHSSY